MGREENKKCSICEKNIGEKFIINGLTGIWIFYGIEKNHGNDYGLSAKIYPYRYYFFKESNPDSSHKVIDVNNLIKLNKNTMNKLQSLIKKMTRKEPEKSFIEVGFMDECENITEDGKEALQYILWDANKEELKKLADKVNAENNK